LVEANPKDTNRQCQKSITVLAPLLVALD